MSIQAAWQLHLDFIPKGELIVEPSQGELTSDAGLLPIRQFDANFGFSEALAMALVDRRDPLRAKHTLLEMMRCRLYGILAGYEDQNDHDTLRYDPCFKLIAGRRPDEPELASQPTLSRFENEITIADLKRLREAFVEQFVASFSTPPTRLTFDLDAVDDPAHGEQQLTFFHGFYGQHQYLPMLISCADNDQFVTLSLRHGTARAALGADDDLEYLVTRLRQHWPTLAIAVRGDCGFGVPAMYAVCERHGLDYTFGFAANAVLKRKTAALLAEAEQRFQETGQPQRLFEVFRYQAKSWKQPRWIVAKAECHNGGTNRRFVITNRPGAPILPEGTYDEYVMRGESENRNKEIKCGLAMDRMSDHRFLANFFRLYLHAAAHNLLVRLRRHIAQPALDASVAQTVLDGEIQAEPLPAAALVGKQRQRYFRLRRQHDLLGRAQPHTWRLHLIKVAAEIITSTRRVIVRLAANWPHLDLYYRLGVALPSPSG
jgi:hypothetical protein